MTKRPNDDDDDNFENGMLKDGHTVRVRMTDAISSRITAADGSQLGLHRPGFRTRVADRADPRKAAYAAYDEAISQEYLRDRQIKTPTGTHEFGDDKPAGSYPLSSGEGTSCTLDGRPGRLVRNGDVLTCIPIRTVKDGAAVLSTEYATYDAQLRDAWRHSGGVR